MVNVLFLGEYPWWTSRSKANPAQAQPGDLGQNGHPRHSWMFQTSFSGKINSNHFLAMGLEQHCLKAFPAKARNTHIRFPHSSRYNQGQSLHRHGPVSLDIGTEALSLWVDQSVPFIV